MAFKCPRLAVRVCSRLGRVGSHGGVGTGGPPPPCLPLPPAPALSAGARLPRPQRSGHNPHAGPPGWPSPSPRRKAPHLAPPPPPPGSLRARQGGPGQAGPGDRGQRQALTRGGGGPVALRCAGRVGREGLGEWQAKTRQQEWTGRLHGEPARGRDGLGDSLATEADPHGGHSGSQETSGAGPSESSVCQSELGAGGSVLPPARLTPGLGK